jgi:hypothetical protein
MTIMEITKLVALTGPALRFKRTTSGRVLHFGEGKGKPFLLVDEREESAPMWSDDLVASDWEVVQAE